MEPLVFQYRAPMLAMMCAGFPLIGGLGVLFLFLPIYLIPRSHLSIGMKIDVLFCAALGAFFLSICVIAVRCWQSYFSKYTVDSSGIKVEFFSSETNLLWKQLKGARYRKALGQIDLRFDGYPYLVVLNNVDMSPQRQTVRAALSLIESLQLGNIEHTLM